MDGKETALRRVELVKDLIVKNNLKLKICILLVGDNPASLVYIKNKAKYCQRAGVAVDFVHLPVHTTQENLLSIIDQKNQDNSIDGILVQLPLPNHLTHLSATITDLIDPKKDVDGFSAYNLGHTLTNQPHAIWPATPRGVVTLLREYNINISGQNIVVIGASNIVGKPLATILQNLGGTVTICNSKTKDISIFTKQADIVCVAIGKPHFITNEFIKDGAVVVDIGINKTSDNKLTGDVDFEKVKLKTSFISPVPGGVGPMTVISILENLLQAKGFRVD